MLMENPFEKMFNELQELKALVAILIERSISTSNDPEEYLEVESTAGYLGLKRSTVYAYKRLGKLKSYKRGSKVYFKKSELNAYIENGHI